MPHIVAVALAAVLLAVTPLDAVAQAGEDHLHFLFGGGVTTPGAELRDRVGLGYNVLFSAQYDLNQIVTVEGLLSINTLGDTQVTIPVSATPFALPIPREFFANMTMQLATANLLLRKAAGPVKPYGVVGMGVYGRPVELSTATTGWVSGYCDPWLYLCLGEGFTTVEQVIGRRNSTDFGIDAGAGANVGVFFSEVRYHYIWGPTIEAPGSDSPAEPTASRTINGEFLAVSFGIRF